MPLDELVDEELEDELEELLDELLDELLELDELDELEPSPPPQAATTSKLHPASRMPEYFVQWARETPRSDNANRPAITFLRESICLCSNLFRRG